MTVVENEGRLINPQLTVYDGSEKICYAIKLSNDDEKIVSFAQFTIADDEIYINKGDRKGFLTIGKGVCDDIWNYKDETKNSSLTTYTFTSFDIIGEGSDRVCNIIGKCFDDTNCVFAELEYHNEFADRHSYFTESLIGESDCNFSESLKLCKKNTVDGNLTNAEGYEQSFEFTASYEDNGEFTALWNTDTEGLVTFVAGTPTGKKVEIAFGAEKDSMPVNVTHDGITEVIE